MPNKAKYQKVATVYMRRDKKKILDRVKKNGERAEKKKGNTPSGNGRIYDTLDRIQRIAEKVAKINRIINGTDEKRSKKQLKKAKKYAKKDKRTGMLVLKKDKGAKRAKSLKREKK